MLNNNINTHSATLKFLSFTLMNFRQWVDIHCTRAVNSALRTNDLEDMIKYE